MKFTPRQKIYLSVGLAALIILILSSAAVFLFDAVGNQGEILLSQKQAAENFYADWRNLETVKKDYLKFEAELAARRALITPKDNVKLIMTLEDIARQNSLSQEIGVINAPAGESATGEQNVLRLQVFLRGAFPNFLKYLICLENLSYLNDLESLQIGRISASDVEQNQNFKGSGAGDINAVLIISAYLQK